MIGDVLPDAVIHCAAWTAVDLAEDAGNAALVHHVNVDGTRNIAVACKAIGCKMIYISTDYVFDGQGNQPWEPDWEDCRPLNVYGKSKREGELAVAGLLDQCFIVRTAWLYGLKSDNFVKTMLKLSQQHATIRVVNDQIGTPTYSRDLARLLVDMAQSDRYGYYHATNEGGYLSWADFAEEILAGSSRVIRVTTAEYGCSKAKRPLNSRLDKSKLTKNGFTPLPHWKDALARYLKEIGH